jgi:hypothetical protein
MAFGTRAMGLILVRAYTCHAWMPARISVMATSTQPLTAETCARLSGGAFGPDVIASTPIAANPTQTTNIAMLLTRLAHATQ